VACFSLHPRKVITVGDGGVITTRDPALDARFRLLRQHGMSVPDTVRHGSPQVIFESYEVEAFNYRLTDIQAAVGTEQLKRLPEIVARRRALAMRYRERLAAEVPEVAPPVEPNRARTNWQSYAVRLPDGADQRAVMQDMLDKGVSTRRGIMCIHREKPYAGAARLPLPVSEAAQDRTILLPLYPQMTEAEQDRVVAALGEAVRH
jgi:dTDP-4-amino-4,6-dideoxygalactose transaminase